MRSPESLTDYQIAIAFQPTTWASPASTKTNRQSDDWLGAIRVILGAR